MKRFKSRNPLTRICTDMKKLLGSGRPPIEELPPEGAGADSNPDMETEPTSRGKGNRKGKNLKNGKVPCKGKSAAVGEL